MSGRSMRSAQRRPGKGAGQDGSALSDVYKGMLAEAATSQPSLFGDDGRTIKRRRIGHAREPAKERGGTKGGQDRPESGSRSITAPDDDFDDLFEERAAPQVAYDDFEDSEESDVEWEEVDLSNDKGKNVLGSEEEAGGDSDGGDLELVLLDPKGNGKRSSIPKRKPITAIERKTRLEAHKMHLLCLLYHVFLRNSWCNDPETQAILKLLLTSRVVSLLSPDPGKTQFQRNELFSTGLKEASALWASKFKITARGMKRAIWADDEEKLKNYRLPEDVDLPMEKPDFRDHARKLEGSRDVGAQLFCALLRSVGVTARLVCSLQPLPFNFAAATKGAMPQKSQPKVIYAAEDSQGNTSEETGSVDVHNMNAKAGSKSSPDQGALPQTPTRARRLWQPKFGRGSRDLGRASPAPKTPRIKRIRESAYPVYWVEAFNVAHQRWIPVDPLTTHSVGKPSKLEPPASESENSMSYVVAFEDAGDARDVTKRYVKAINAKTRKARVEATKGGDRWWKKVMRFFEREFGLDRDQVEDAEFADREAREEMPRNVQDFKGHPYYALERHLKRNEVIHPRREIGRLTTGLASKGRSTEPIYRQSDVHIVKSADGWYRAGRDIKPGEQPLKHIRPRRSKVHSLDDDEQSDPDGGAGTGLYAAFQTAVYEPPPVIRGQVPKNSYGNIDTYVPSMVPKGGIHLPYSDAARAARLLCIDYADAVTGFEFKGRHGTAIIRGIVAAAEYREALEVVIQAFADAREEEEVANRSMRALAFWKRFLVGLRIRERIVGYEIPGEAEETGRGELVEEEAKKVDGKGDGERGYLPGRSEADITESSAGNVLRWERRRRSPYMGVYQPEEDADEGFRLIDSNSDVAATECGGGFVPDAPPASEPLNWYEGDGGGFVPEEGDAITGGSGLLFGDGGDGDGGGFIPEDDTTDATRVGFLSDDGDRAATRGGGFPADNSDDNDNSHLFLATTTKDARPPHPPSKNPSSIPGEQTTRSSTRQTNTMHPPTLPDNPGNQEDGRHPDADANTDVDAPETSSLLSHDPEDDDAEPDWLLSD